MIDPKLLRSSPADVSANLARRNFDFDAATYSSLEEKRKSLQVDVEKLLADEGGSDAAGD